VTATLDRSERRLALRFKGDRSYLHGTDMFDETLTWLSSTCRGEIAEIDFSFHRLATHQLAVVPEPCPSHAKPVAVCAFALDGIRRKVFLVESDEAVAGRYPYPEDEIVRPLEIDGTAHRGVLRGPSAYSEIEVWIATTKALHVRTIPESRGKWLFVRGRFPKYVRKAEAHERTLTIAAGIGGRLTRTEVRLDGTPAGEIYFSLT
jgi:hypothetical protein